MSKKTANLAKETERLRQSIEDYREQLNQTVELYRDTKRELDLTRSDNERLREANDLSSRKLKEEEAFREHYAAIIVKDSNRWRATVELEQARRMVLEDPEFVANQKRLIKLEAIKLVNSARAAKGLPPIG